MPKQNEKTDAQIKEQARRQVEAAKRTKARLANKPITQATPNPAHKEAEDNGGKKPKSVRK